MDHAMTCDDVETLLAIHAVGGGLETEETRAVNVHLNDCAACRRTGAAFLSSSALLPLALPQHTPPARLRHRLMAQVYSEAADRPLAAPSPPRGWRRVTRSRPLAFGAGLAIAAALAVVAALPLVNRSHDAGAETVAIALQGTASMPHAHGVLDYDPQRHRAVVTVEGLTPPSAGTVGAAPPVYELWLLPAHTAAVAAGTLSLQPDGHTWMAAIGMNAPDYRAVAATLEPAGGSSSPTGPQVLAGQLTG